MAQHVLSLEAPDTMNKCILRIVDTSVYNQDAPPKCFLLQVTPPGFAVPTNFEDGFIAPGFNLNLTACDLEMQKNNCGSVYADLPDGIYIIRYAVSPTDQVYVEYNHLRETCAWTRYQAILCDLDIAACDPPATVKSKMNQLALIRTYLDAAKAKVEFCHEPEKGMELYKYAVKLLNKMDCSSSCKTC